MKPSSARNIEATLIDKDQVSISWKPPNSGGKVKGYKVKCGDIETDVPSDVSIVKDEFLKKCKQVSLLCLNLLFICV